MNKVRFEGERAEICARFPVRLFEMLSQVAEELGISKNRLINESVKRYLKTVDKNFEGATPIA